MPKLKTHSGAKKRFNLTKTGKVKRAHAFKSHILTKKDITQDAPEHLGALRGRAVWGRDVTRHKSTPFPAKKTGYFPQHCSAFCNAAGLPSLFHPFTIFICPAFFPIRPSSTAPALSQGFSPLLNLPHLSNCSRSLRQPHSLILIQIGTNQIGRAHV